MDYSSAGADTPQPNTHSNPYNHHQGAGSPAYTPFRHPSTSSIEPALDQSQSNGRPQLAAHVSPSPTPTPPHPHSSLMHDAAPLGTSSAPQHMSGPHSFYPEMGSRASITPSTPSNTAASPHFTNTSSTSPRQQKQSLPAPTDRPITLPSRDVTEDTIDDAYTAFILYCNPSFSASTDTSELVKAFRQPPRSDGKLFSSWHLFELIRKFDQKEIKTWTQLALDLGVEPPSSEKGQSAQKVQQYSVRLKRWMRAMHIDAFFEYLVGNQHGYFTQIPSLSNPFPPQGRDGVNTEEDLALRALDPKFKPKRGRRKTEDQDDDMDDSATPPPPKRPQLDTSVGGFASSGGYGNPSSAYPHSALPMSAHPDELERFANQDPWSAVMTPASRLGPHSAISNPPGQHLRWRLNTQDHPTTPHPLSAVTPLTAHPPDSAFDEPQSAITPSTSKARSRRRHGPAVSSAWSSNNLTPNGKMRGRPPSNRSVRDGPFVTFPANPRAKEGPVIDINRNSPGSMPPHGERASSEGAAPISSAPSQDFRFPPTPASAVSVSSQVSQAFSAPPGRPSRLHLQVPQHVGGPVHLITPTLVLNAESETPASTIAPASAMSTTSQRASPHFFEDNNSDAGDADSGFTMPFSQPQPAKQSTSRSAPPSAIQPNHHRSAQNSIKYESVKRALAADLLRADLHGRKQRLRGSEAKSLAAALLRRTDATSSVPPNHVSTSHLPTPHSTTREVAAPYTVSALAASWLGLSSTLGLTGSEQLPPTQTTIRKIVSRRFRISSDGYDSPIDDDDDMGDVVSTMDRPNANIEESKRNTRRIREQFDVSWTITLGSLTADVAVRGVNLDEEEEGEGGQHSAGIAGRSNGGPGGPFANLLGTDPGTLSARVETLEKTLKERDEELRRLKEKVLDAVL